MPLAMHCLPCFCGDVVDSMGQVNLLRPFGRFQNGKGWALFSTVNVVEMIDWKWVMRRLVL
jgi:hypothetical protein